MQRSKKLKKRKEKRFDKTIKTKPLALDILKMHYSVRCEIRKYEKKKKNRTKNKEMIPLKESLEMFYILRVALKRRCKDAFFGQQLPAALQGQLFFSLFFSQNKQ